MLKPISVASGEGKNLPDDASIKEFDEILQIAKKVLLLQKLGFPNPWFPMLLTPIGTGTTRGSEMGTPPWMHMPFFQPFLVPWAVPPGMTPLGMNSTTPAGSPRVEEDLVELLSDSEAREFKEFNPLIEPENTWEPSTAMKSFLEHHFNSVLRERHHVEFFKPNCSVLQVPQLDDLVQ